MGSFSSGGAGGLIERAVAGRAGDVGAGIVSARENTGFGAYNYGSSVSEEGLGGLRNLRSSYQNQLSDPLGQTGRNIFALGRGQLQDDYSRSIGAGSARRAQLAAASGGALTAEQQSALDQQNQRDASDSLFRGENQLAQAQASATLTASGKLYDRMEGIDQTLTGVGQQEKTRGLQSVLAALELGLKRNAAIDSSTRSWVSMFMGGGAGKGPGG